MAVHYIAHSLLSLIFEKNDGIITKTNECQSLENEKYNLQLDSKICRRLIQYNSEKEKAEWQNTRKKTQLNE